MRKEVVQLQVPLHNFSPTLQQRLAQGPPLGTLLQDMMADNWSAEATPRPSTATLLVGHKEAPQVA